MKRRYQKKPSSLRTTCGRCGGPCSVVSESKLCKLCYTLPWEPTHDEIRAACREIQATWSVAEELRARTSAPTEWSVPVIAMPSVESG